MTTKDLYDALISKRDLHSLPQQQDNVLFWPLYKKADILVTCENGYVIIEIVRNSRLMNTLIRLKIPKTDALEELYKLGKKGNLLVLKKGYIDASIFYAGPASTFPLPPNTPLHFGRRKYDGGQLV